MHAQVQSAAAPANLNWIEPQPEQMAAMSAPATPTAIQSSLSGAGAGGAAGGAEVFVTVDFTLSMPFVPERCITNGKGLALEWRSKLR